MAGKSGSDVQDVQIRATPPGTWRVTGDQAIQGRHGEVLGMANKKKGDVQQRPRSSHQAEAESHLGNATAIVPFAGDPSGSEGLEHTTDSGEHIGNVVLPPLETVVVRDNSGQAIVWATRLGQDDNCPTSDGWDPTGWSGPSGYNGPRDFTGSYRSYVYEVRYVSNVERAIPKPLSAATSTDTISDDLTYMRVLVPNFQPATDMEWLGVALCMEGGRGTGGSVERFEDLASSDLCFLMSYLASGYDLVGRTSFFRSGEPMITAAFNYPGRGRSAGGCDLEAEGAADFLHDSPGNATGQDYCGDMTFDATEAVVQVLLQIVEDLRQRWDEHPSTFGSLGSEGHRLVVASRSWGLNPASRWIANTEVSIHALVDWEGPTDSAEALGVTYDYNPFLDPDGPPYTDLTLEVFIDWAVHNRTGFLFWLRPPETGLFATSHYPSIFPQDWSPFVTRLERTHGRKVADMWSDRYQGFYPSMGDGSLASQVDSFWSDRVAMRWLPEVTARHAAYVRIQNNDDHAQPLHMYQRHAIKALNAAFEGGGQHVYYAGESYWADLLRGSDPSPDRMERDFDVDQPFLDEGSGAWGDSDFWPDFVLTIPWGRNWQPQVDLVRWAVQTRFHWRSSTTLYPGSSFDMTEDRIETTRTDHRWTTGQSRRASTPCLGIHRPPE